jgi:hypothetical protein
VKISKASWISLIIGAIIIAAASLGWTYSQEADQQTQLNNKLAQANQQLAQIKLDDLNAQKSQLTQQIGQVNSQIAGMKTNLSASEDSIDATNVILEDAKSHNVNVLEMTSSGLSTESVANTSLQTLTISLKVSGSIRNITGLVASLSEQFPTSAEKAVQIERVQPTTSPSPTPTPTPVTTPEPPSTPSGTPTATSTPSPTPTAVPEEEFSADITLIIYNYEGK